MTTDALGINPFSAPRLDEQQPLLPDQEKHLVAFATLDSDKRAEYAVPVELLAHEGFGYGVEQFQLHPTIPWYGLWAVANQWKDISDLASVKEQHSYAVLDRPYKFLQATDKKNVDKDTRGATAAMRKQFAVLLDFNDGRVYIENSNKKTIYLVKELLRSLGAEIIAVGWNFNRPHWPSAILGHLYESSHYLNDFQKRADETTRFRPRKSRSSRTAKSKPLSPITFPCLSSKANCGSASLRPPLSAFTTPVNPLPPKHPPAPPLCSASPTTRKCSPAHYLSRSNHRHQQEGRGNHLPQRSPLPRHQRSN